MSGGHGVRGGGSANGVCIRAPPTFGVQSTLWERISCGPEWGMRRPFYWGVRPSTWPHLLVRCPCAGGITPTFPADILPTSARRIWPTLGRQLVNRTVPCLLWT
jgi:hypothetical protein